MLKYNQVKECLTKNEIWEVRGLDINASIHADGFTEWDEIEQIVTAREAIADEIIEVFARNSLTVMTAHDILDRVDARIEAAVNGSPVGALCTRRTSPKGSQTL